MIHVNRDRSDDKGKPIRPGKSWFKRSKDAKDVALEEKGKHEAKGSIYASVSVRRALEKLFHFKCAYCESSIANQDWDVEHFRPKGRVAEREKHTGYYWLAYEWTNLYPSCTGEDGPP